MNEQPVKQEEDWGNVIYLIQSKVGLAYVLVQLGYSDENKQF